MNARVPRASVIIPAFDSDRTIGKCFDALRAQTFRDFETIVVNSSPEDRTEQIVTTQYPEIIFKQSAKRLFPHAARNLGISFARGELLVFSDPDCIPRPTWLEQLVRAYDDGHAIVQGSVELIGTSWRERAIHLCKRFSLLPGLAPYSPWIVSTVNACYTRLAWDAAGPFAGELFCADALLTWRAIARGYRTWFEPSAIVENAHHENIAELFRERFERGKEFGNVRAEYERWSRWRAAGYLFAFPTLLVVILWRTFQAARAAGWLRSFWVTLPIPIIGQLAWLLGESIVYFARAISRVNTLTERDAQRFASQKNVGLYRSDS
jgi:glycosyltransferase involved in cell wall biosynthesis